MVRLRPMSQVLTPTVPLRPVELTTASLQSHASLPTLARVRVRPLDMSLYSRATKIIEMVYDDLFYS